MHAVATARHELQLTTGTPATLVRPDGNGPWPGVVMIHEVFGVDEVLRRQADRSAAAGYLVTSGCIPPPATAS